MSTPVWHGGDLDGGWAFGVAGLNSTLFGIVANVIQVDVVATP